jgi:hypothetical protein
MVAKAKNLKALGFDSSRSLRVGPFPANRKVLAAIKFNDKLGGVAHKIRNVIVNRDLSAESGSNQSMTA